MGLRDRGGREPVVLDGRDRIVGTDADPAAEPPDIVVYTLSWAGDRAARDGERPNGQIYTRVFVNGEEVKYAVGITVDASSDFMTAALRLAPGTLRFVHLEDEAFRDPDLRP